LLTVEKKEDMLFLNFPTDTITLLPKEENINIGDCLGVLPVESYKGKCDYMAVIDNEKLLKNLNPNFSQIAKLNTRGLIVTAKGDSVDFVSRYFAPQSGIDEDPVTGSAHTSLLPIWAKKLNKTKFMAHQISKRGGELICEFKNDRCFIGGKAILYLTGEIILNEL
jgi:predicted PhzF superfamily epimerase YddE/YHI9